MGIGASATSRGVLFCFSHAAWFLGVIMVLLVGRVGEGVEVVLEVFGMELEVGV